MTDQDRNRLQQLSDKLEKDELSEVEREEYETLVRRSARS
jgi:hypothetical protein